MVVTAIRTHKITTSDKDIFKILEKYLEIIEEGSVLAISSKIIAICEGRTVKIGEKDKEELVRSEADFYIPKENNKYGITVSVKKSILVASGGIDESNGNGYYVLWPEKPQESANKIRKFLRKKFGLKKFGVVITDTRNVPLRYGAAGASIAHSGFKAIKDYRGKKDLFDKVLKVSKTNVADSLASSAVLVMGEGDEQTPLALISDIPFVEFRDEDPSREELELLCLNFDNDLFHELFEKSKWKKRV